MRLNLTNFSSTKTPVWLNRMMRDCAEAHDIKFGNIFKEYCATPNGARTLARWLKDVGYRVEYWCIEPLIKPTTPYNSKTTTYLGFGLEIDDACPMFVELKLKC